MSITPKVVVAMSGGVDSSVAAALLRRQGYEVIGMMLRLWSEPGHNEDNRCCTPDALALARRMAALSDIPFYAIDAQQVFQHTVVEYFINGYAKGITPNPCLVCNQYIRWGFLLQKALSLDAQFLATGHYARLRLRKNGRLQLLRGIDTQKDQSYVLHMLNQDQLSHTLFPLGEYTKTQVRQMARDFGLPVAERIESQDLCFLGSQDYRDFLRRNAPQLANPGPIYSSDGKQLGQHSGLAFYTIGQRKGLGLSTSTPLYTLAKNIQNNALIVGNKEELGRRHFIVEGMNWISGETPIEPFRAQVKIRYKASDAWGMVMPFNKVCVRVNLTESLRDITPGQAAVFYDGDACLGGGLIQSS